MERIPMTTKGREKLEKELKELKDVKRPQIAADVARFRDMGDLRENADYHAAREELAMTDAKIAQLEGKLSLAQMVDPDKMPTDSVVFGTRVTIVDLASKEEETFDLVGEGEADIKANKILTTSPLAQALLAKKVGDVAEFKGPRRTVKYRILKIRPQE